MQSGKVKRVMIFVDEPEKIDGLLPVLQEMVSEGLIVVDEVEAIRRNGHAKVEEPAPDMVANQHLVSEYLDESPMVVSPDTSIEDVVKILLEHNRAYLPVISEGGVLLGMLSSRDVLRKIVHLPDGAFHFFFLRGPAKHEVRKDIKSLSAADVMRTHFHSVEPDTPMVKAAQIMLHDRISALAVTKEHKLVGILRLPYLLKKALAIELEDQAVK